jgi:hypothetical protein
LARALTGGFNLTANSLPPGPEKPLKMLVTDP